MSSGIISTSVTGLQAAQLGLLTTEHNIANANTPGFSRQRTIQATNPAVLTGAGFIGLGTHVATIERMYSRFLTEQVDRSQASVSALDAYHAQISQIDNLLADPATGLSPALQDFFASVQQVATDPSQLPSREAMISTAQSQPELPAPITSTRSPAKGRLVLYWWACRYLPVKAASTPSG